MRNNHLRHIEDSRVFQVFSRCSSRGQTKALACTSLKLATLAQSITSSLFITSAALILRSTNMYCISHQSLEARRECARMLMCLDRWNLHSIKQALQPQWHYYISPPTASMAPRKHKQPVSIVLHSPPLVTGCRCQGNSNCFWPTEEGAKFDVLMKTRSLNSTGSCAQCDGITEE